MNLSADAVQAAAQVLLDDYTSKIQNNLDWTEFEPLARAVLEAAITADDQRRFRERRRR